MAATATIRKLLIANRGAIAVRIQRTARDLGIATLGVFPADDEQALHALTADEGVQLDGGGIRQRRAVRGSPHRAGAAH